ncbi:MAG: spheroidene monooxygenase [Actinomycetota bacterium]
MACDRFLLRKIKGLHFSKSLGCGKGTTFTPMDADILRWGVLVCIEAESESKFDNSKLVNRWRRISESEFRVVLKPLGSHGKWSGQQPFDISTNSTNGVSSDGHVAAITRARVSFNKYPHFLRSLPAVVKDLHAAPGLLGAIGIGEAPIGLQGTFSMWESSQALQNFAFKGAAHSQAITDTKKFDWYSEELFARFSVQEIRGSL